MQNNDIFILVYLIYYVIEVKNMPFKKKEYALLITKNFIVFWLTE